MMYPYQFGMNPYQNQMMPTQMSVTNQQIIKVNGENGARAYQMPANASVLLLDESAPIVWLAQTDGAGYKTISPYKIEPYKADPAPDLKSLEDRIIRLEGMLNGKSNITDDKQ